MSDFILPDIGEGIVECELVKWLIEEGDTIEEDQPVAEVMTDKALVEIPAPYKGRIVRLYHREGETARVHAPLFALEADDEAVEESASEVDEETLRADQPEAGETPAARDETTLAAEVPGRPPVSEAPNDETLAQSSGEEPAERAASDSTAERRRIPASPAVRRLVRESGLRLEDVPGSGRHGRVFKEDVLSCRQGAPGDERSREAAREERPTAPSERLDRPPGEVRVEALRGVRAAMARRMATAAATIPHFAYGDEIDVTELLALRDRFKPQAEAQGTRLTLMPFVMKAMALAIQSFPILNSRLDDSASEIHYQPHCNIGMAVDSQAGLLVPNVKRVERLTLWEIAAEVERLTRNARDGRVDQADLQDGTISISNIGALGGTHATPIVNLPEVAIVALGRILQLPRFDDAGAVVSRAIMTVTWSGDHRILDGGTIARFCNQWKAYLQSPQTMLLEMR